MKHFYGFHGIVGSYYKKAENKKSFERKLNKFCGATKNTKSIKCNNYEKLFLLAHFKSRLPISLFKGQICQIWPF